MIGTSRVPEALQRAGAGESPQDKESENPPWAAAWKVQRAD